MFLRDPNRAMYRMCNRADPRSSLSDTRFGDGDGCGVRISGEPKFRRHARGKLGFTEASSAVLEFFGDEHLKKMMGRRMPSIATIREDFDEMLRLE